MNEKTNSNFNQKVIYIYHLEAKTPFFTGASEQGELLLDANNEPFIPGNSIGGALREYLERTKTEQEEILSVMGGEQTETDSSSQGEVKEFKTFRESTIFISDGQISFGQEAANVPLIKEGTRIDSQYGTAKDNYKYEFKYLPAGFKLCFSIEFDVWQYKHNNLDTNAVHELINRWAKAIDDGHIRFGGKKSTDFGRFKVEKLEQQTYSFSSIKAIDDYLLSRSERNEKNGWKIKEFNDFKEPSVEEQSTVVFELQGKFPYGVYQSFLLDNEESQQESHSKKGLSKTITGLQKNGNSNSRKIPASSMKGLLKHHYVLLVRRILKKIELTDDLIDKKFCAPLFGGEKQIGQLIVSDFIMDKSKKVKVYRSSEVKDNKHELIFELSNPNYNKLDRLTGGVIKNALKTQVEAAGEASLRLELRINNEVQKNYDEDKINKSPFIFPLIYILRQIGLGKIAVGGRTAIGLGQFEANQLKVADNSKQQNLNLHDLHLENLDEKNKEALQPLYETFVNWLQRTLTSKEDRT